MRFEVARINGGIENAYLLKGGRVALVDTLAPTGWRKLLKALQRSRVALGDIEFILITHHHFDHCGNLARLRELSGATVVAGELDAPVIEGTRPNPPPGTLNRLGRTLAKLPPSLLRSYQKYDRAGVDRRVAGGEEIEELGLEVMALPGHTGGGVGFLDREGKRAWVGDMVSNYFSRPGMPTISASESLEEIFSSQQLIAGLGLQTVFPGHGAVIQPDASAVIGRMTEKKRAAIGDASS